MKGLARRLARLGGPFAGPGVLLLLASGAGAFLGYTFWFLTARQAEPVTVGSLSVLVSAIAAVSLLATAGLAPSAAVSLSTTPPHRSRISSLAALLVVVIAAVLAVTVVVVGSRFTTLEMLATFPAATAFVAGSIATALAVLLDAIHNALLRPGMVLARALLHGIARLMFLVLFLVFSSTALGVTAGLVLWAVAAAAGTLLLLTSLVRAGLLTGRLVLADVGLLTGALRWQQAVTLAGQLPVLLLPPLVAARAGAEAAAGFYLAWQLAAGCFMTQTAVTPTLLVRTAARPAEQAASLRAAYRLLLLLIVPLSVAVAVGGPLALSLLGGEYRTAIPILLILTLSALPDAVSALHVAHWRALGRARTAAALNTMLALAVLIGSWLLVPVFGPVAVAWVFLAAQTVGAVTARLVGSRITSSAEGQPGKSRVG